MSLASTTARCPIDHAALTGRDLDFLSERAALLDAGLVTTEKDWVRLPPAWRARIAAWPVFARFEDEAAFARYLTGVTTRQPT